MAQILLESTQILGLESTHVFENWYNVNIKILACQIIGPAAGPVPTALYIGPYKINIVILGLYVHAPTNNQVLSFVT